MQVSTMKLFLLIAYLNLPATYCFFSDCSKPQNYTVSYEGSEDEKCDHHASKSLRCVFVRTRTCTNVTIANNLTLTRNLTLDNATDLTITGNKAFPVTITCKKDVGLVLVNPRRVHLQGLRFSSCSVKCPSDNASIYPLLDYAAVCVHEGSEVNITGCIFTNSTTTGAIMHDVMGEIWVKDTNFTGNANFNNYPQTSGGLIIKRLQIRGESNYTIEGCRFEGNENQMVKSSLGGGLHLHLGAEKSSSFVELTLCLFSENKAALGGGGMHINQTGRNSFLFLRIQNSAFTSNRAGDKGGGIFLFQNKSMSSTCRLQIVGSVFSGNRGKWGGGMTIDGANVNLEANTSSWLKNSADNAAFAVAVNGSKMLSKSIPDVSTHFEFLSMFRNCHFIGNLGTYNDANSIGAVQVKHSKAEFHSCSFQQNIDTALNIRKSGYAIFSGNTTFASNSGITGAAIYVDCLSSMILKEGVHLHFEHNSALIDGGAIYTEPVSVDFYAPTDICVFEAIKAQLKSTSEEYAVSFISNTAAGEDQSVFVGSSKGCVNSSRDGTTLLSYKKIFTFEPQKRSQVVSGPSNITLTGSPSNAEGSLEVMLGQYFFLIPNVLDIFNNTAYLFGYLQLVYNNSRSRAVVVPSGLKLVGPKIISMDSFTKDNVLYITGDNSYIDMENLYVEIIYNKVSSYHTNNRTLRVKIVDCKVGYDYNSSSGMCECISSDILSCDPHSSRACIRYGYWLGSYDLTDGETFPCSGQNCQYADGKCPGHSEVCSKSLQDFCQLNASDDLCWDGRGGIMCSSCRQNYSFTFGGLMCVHSDSCLQVNTALITLGIILYWIVIIIFLLFILNLNLRTGLGIMYGIVYYFSVLSLFTDKTITGPVLVTIINTCIAMTQLSPRMFGDIPVCFAKSWDLNIHHYLFQFVTPIFVIGMIVLIILVSRYCRCPKAISLAENSPIHAICVLVLFSYTSLTYTSFQILKPIKIKGELRVYADPEVRYFGRTHLPYALMALLFEFCISLPICFLLLFAPCLVKRVNLVKLKLKPIVDDLQACYRPECRWFAGFYFVARQLMYLANTVPAGYSLPQDNMILHFTNSAILIIHSSLQPYKLKWLNVLDTLLLIDIFFLSFFSLGWSSNFIHRAVPYIFILPPAFYLLLLTILMTCKRLFKCVVPTESIKSRMKAYLRRRQAVREQTLPQTPTHNSVGLDDEKESADKSKGKSLLGSDFFKDFGEREPLLADTDTSEQLPSFSCSTGDELGHMATSSSLKVSALRRFPPRNNSGPTK